MPGPNDYTLGWICAIQIEYDDVSSNTSAADSNYYTIERIGKHNVLLVVRPKDNAAQRLLHPLQEICCKPLAMSVLLDGRYWRW